MPSPFPGMDPYLEDPGIWPDFDNSLATHIRNSLNRSLPSPYYALLDTREELGLLGEPHSRVIVPDVAISSRATMPEMQSGSFATAVAGPRTEITPWVEFEIDTEPYELCSIEIRNSHFGHELVTLIEILSPSNKLRGADRESYLQKRRETLASTTSLVEIDLLRTGERVSTEDDYSIALHELIPQPDYLITVNRGWKRGPLARLNYQVFPILLQSSLPVIPIPLRQTDVEPPLDLQFVFDEVYEGSGYHRGAVDYLKPPVPAVSPAVREWCAERVRQVLVQSR